MTDSTIIVGAGPAGSTLAFALAQANLPVLLLGKEEALSMDLEGLDISSALVGYAG